MNTQTTNKTELITWLDSTTNLGKDFLSEQVPLYEQELLTHAFMSNLIWGVWHSIVLIALIYFSYKLGEAKQKETKFLFWDFDG